MKRWEQTLRKLENWDGTTPLKFRREAYYVPPFDQNTPLWHDFESIEVYPEVRCAKVKAKCGTTVKWVLSWEAHPRTTIGRVPDEQMCKNCLRKRTKEKK